MTYEIYRKIKSRETYFDSWEAEQVKAMTEILKDRVYQKYVLKCKIFQRDNFTCQNCDPDVKHSKELTIHHYKHRRNNGKVTERNCVTICKLCHKRFNKAKAPLIFANVDSLPSHMRGQTQMLHKPEKKINWKKLKAEMKKLRKELKYSGIKYENIDWELLMTLMMWLSVPYEEFDD